MSSSGPILLVSHEQDTARAVAEAAGGSEPVVRAVCASLEDLLIRMDDEVAPVVLVELNGAPERMLGELEPIVGRFPETRFVVVAEEREADLLLRAMQCGVRHVLRRADLTAELPAMLSRMLATPAPRLTARGSVITVLSAGGGCGATTLAINLANELGVATKSPALLIDFDLSYGSVASFLGIEAQFGVADLLADEARIDANLLRSTVHPFSAALHVLVSPAAVEFDPPRVVSAEPFPAALHRCREVYPHTVIDAPRVAMSVAAQLAGASLITLIALEANVKDLRVARKMHDALVARRVTPSRIVPIVVKHRGRSESIRLEEVRQTIGCERVEVLIDDAKSSGTCVNYGKTLADEAPRSPLRVAIAKLADTIRASVSADRKPGKAST